MSGRKTMDEPSRDLGRPRLLAVIWSRPFLMAGLTAALLVKWNIEPTEHLEPVARPPGYADVPRTYGWPTVYRVDIRRIFRAPYIYDGQVVGKAIDDTTLSTSWYFHYSVVNLVIAVLLVGCVALWATAFGPIRLSSQFSLKTLLLAPLLVAMLTIGAQSGAPIVDTALVGAIVFLAVFPTNR